MLASELIERAGWLLADVGQVRYGQETLLKFASDAQRQVALRRPDATATTAVVQLAPGTLQAIPADGLRLLDISRLMGADGQTPGRAVRLADRKVLDAAEPEWHTAAASPLLEHYVYDIRTPRLFYVFPPVPDDTSVWLELIYSMAPAELASPEDALAVADVYAPAVLDYMLHLAWSMDVDSVTSRDRAAERLAAFTSSLDAKLNADLMMTPNSVSA